METILKLSARLVVTLAVCANGVFAQAQTQAPSKLAGDCPEMAEAKARLEAQEKRLKDWPDLARYRDANARVAAPAKNEKSGAVVGGSITEPAGAPPFCRLFFSEAHNG